jgi:hypothetical protein
MKFLYLFLASSLFFCGLAHADCSSAVSNKIKNNGFLEQSDRSRLMDDCKKYQDYRLSVKDSPDVKGAYILNPGAFSCRKREDYVDAYNWVLERGGKYDPSIIDGTNKSRTRFKSCETIKTPTLVAVRTQKDPESPIYEILYHSQYSVYLLHEGWIHGTELIPYSNLLKARVK